VIRHGIDQIGVVAGLQPAPAARIAVVQTAAAPPREVHGGARSFGDVAGPASTLLLAASVILAVREMLRLLRGRVSTGRWLEPPSSGWRISGQVRRVRR
jgi:hypothetical protein